MKPSIKQYLIAAAFVLAGIFGAWVSYKFTSAELASARMDAKTLRGEVTALNLALDARDRAATLRREATNTVEAKHAESRAALVLERSDNPEWDRTPVPDGIAGVLYDAANRRAPDP